MIETDIESPGLSSSKFEGTTQEEPILAAN
jgi:hypothetical protein